MNDTIECSFCNHMIKPGEAKQEIKSDVPGEKAYVCQDCAKAEPGIVSHIGIGKLE